MRAVFFGHAQDSVACLSRLVTVPGIELAAIVTRRAAPGYTDFVGLGSCAESLGVPALLGDEMPAASLGAALRALAPDVAFAFGWATVLTRDVLDAFPMGVVGYHPAPLPRGRGHHPIVWALALGLDETASTLFVLDDGIDTGDIVNQRRVAIAPDEDAGSLYARLTGIALDQIEDVARDLVGGTIRRVPQDHGRASVWRRRGHEDGRVDWRMSASGICNLVRALARPYAGAHCLIDGADVKIWRARIAAITAPKDVEPGRVLAATDPTFVVKCGDGAVEIVEYERSAPPRRGVCLR